MDEYISNYIFLILKKKKNMNSMNGTSIGIVNSQKNPKIWSGNNPSRPVYNIYQYMCKVLFGSGDWYVYLYQFSFPLKDDCTLDRRVLYIWKYLLLIWRTPPCGDKWQIICASSAVFHFTPVVSMQIKAKCQKPNQY